MPLYEYYCADCASKFEILSLPSADTNLEVACQKCHSTHVRKLISVFTAHRGGDGEFNDGYHWDTPSGGCGCGGQCGCGKH
jgi:putative FmdB family regulatory protein